MAGLAVGRGDWTRATALYEECLAAERRAENGRGIARALLGLSLVAARRLDFARAAQLAGQALHAAREAGDPAAEAQAEAQIAEASTST